MLEPSLVANSLRQRFLDPAANLRQSAPVKEFEGLQADQQFQVLDQVLSGPRREVEVCLQRDASGRWCPSDLRVSEEIEVPGRDIVGHHSVALPTHKLTSAQKEALWLGMLDQPKSLLSLGDSSQEMRRAHFCVKALRQEGRELTAESLKTFCQQYPGVFPVELTALMWSRTERPEVALEVLHLAEMRARAGGQMPGDALELLSQVVGVDLPEVQGESFDRLVVASSELERLEAGLIRKHLAGVPTDLLPGQVEKLRDASLLCTWTRTKLQQGADLDEVMKQCTQAILAERSNCPEYLAGIAERQECVAEVILNKAQAAEARAKKGAGRGRRVASPRATRRCLVRQLSPRFECLAAQPEVVANLKDFLAFARQRLAQQPEASPATVYQDYVASRGVVTRYRAVAVSPEEKQVIEEAGFHSGAVRQGLATGEVKLGLAGADLNSVIHRHMADWQESPLLSVSPDRALAATVARSRRTREDQDIWVFELQLPQASLFASSPQEELAFVTIPPEQIVGAEKSSRFYQPYLPASQVPWWDQ